MPSAATYERVANDFQTTLGAAVVTAPASGTQEAWTVAAAAPTALQNGQFRIRVDNEICTVISGQSGTTWQVLRGQEGTTSATHTSGATVDHIISRSSLLDLTLDRDRRLAKKWAAGTRGWTIKPWECRTQGSLSDHVNRLSVIRCPVTPDDAPITRISTYFANSIGAGIVTACKFLLISVDDLIPLGRTADQSTAFQTSGRKDFTLTADAGRSLVIPRDTDEVIIGLWLLGTNTPQFLQIQPNNGTIGAAQAWGWHSGYISSRTTGPSYSSGEPPAGEAIAPPKWSDSYQSLFWAELGNS